MQVKKDQNLQNFLDSITERRMKEMAAQCFPLQCGAVNFRVTTKIRKLDPRPLQPMFSAFLGNILETLQRFDIPPKMPVLPVFIFAESFEGNYGAVHWQKPGTPAAIVIAENHFPDRWHALFIHELAHVLAPADLFGLDPNALNYELLTQCVAFITMMGLDKSRRVLEHMWDPPSYFLTEWESSRTERDSVIKSKKDTPEAILYRLLGHFKRRS